MVSYFLKRVLIRGSWSEGWSLADYQITTAVPLVATISIELLAPMVS